MAQRLPILYQNKPCYDIYITRDFNDIPREFEPFVTSGQKICIVTDSNVRGLYANALKEELPALLQGRYLYAARRGGT